MPTVIQIENLFKEYRLGVIGHGTLTHDLQTWWAKIRGKEDPNSKLPMMKGQKKQIEGDRFWALKGINLKVNRGEVLGIIGKNGAGKSTLLKILSRVTAPSSGTIKVKGRIASLLEVGTGFHPELTGMENIFMNGAILGMSKHEIKRKLDEIIDFSGVEEFIDTPVKRYSSGMYVRLAFAVAAHLETEIMVVDEVLAVGDAEFQKKCLGKINDIASYGRTVLFVSHNMQSISLLTQRCILMENGLVTCDDDTISTVDTYLQKNNTFERVFNKPPDNHKPSIIRIEIKTSNSGNVHINQEPLAIEFDLHSPNPIVGARFSFQIIDKSDKPIIHIWISSSDLDAINKEGVFTLKCFIPKARIYKGTYTIKAYFTGPPGGEKFHILERVCPFKVEMLKTKTEHKFIPDTCTYIEDFYWEVIDNDL